MVTQADTDRIERLYLVAPDQLVFTFSRCADGSFRFSRLSSHHTQKFVMRYGLEKKYERSWALQDNSPGMRSAIFGWFKEASEAQQQQCPPLGNWMVWGSRFTLTRTMPQYQAIASPIALELPFASMKFAEEGNVGRIDICMRNVAITDEDLEKCLSEFLKIVQNLARRPNMILIIFSDGRDAQVPAMRHVRRLLGFIQENGTELVLVGRGHAIVLQQGIIGNILIGIVRMVQRLVPPPWREVIVSSTEEAEDFLKEVAASYTEVVATAPVASAAPAASTRGPQCFLVSGSAESGGASVVAEGEQPPKAAPLKPAAGGVSSSCSNGSSQMPPPLADVNELRVPKAATTGYDYGAIAESESEQQPGASAPAAFNRSLQCDAKALDSREAACDDMIDVKVVGVRSSAESRWLCPCPAVGDCRK